MRDIEDDARPSLPLAVSRTTFPAFNTEGYARRVLGMTKDDVTLGVPKLFFGYATGSNLMFPFAPTAKGNMRFEPVA